MLWIMTFGCSDTNPTPAPNPEPVAEVQNEKIPTEIKTPPAPSQTPDQSTISLTGTVSYSGELVGSIELEVLYNEPGKDVILIKQETLDSLGEFTFAVPDNPLDLEKGSLSLMAYIDITGDRISDDDPRGYLQLSSLEEKKDLLVTILDSKDLEKQKSQNDSKNPE